MSVLTPSVLVLSLSFLCLRAPQALAQGEIGPDDSRISWMGPDGDPAFWGANAALVRNRAANGFFAVWQGIDDSAPGELEIYGQLLDGTGAPLGDSIRISHMGPDGDPAFVAAHPSIAAEDAGRMLVVWEGSDTTAAELEIHARFLDAAGNPLGESFLVSSMGPEGDPVYEARTPDVVWGPGEYLVVWAGADTTPDEFEIHAQRVVFPDGPIGKDDYRVSTMGVDGDAAIDALEPAVARLDYSSADYAVVWHGDATADGDFEIYYQQLSIEFGHIGPFQPRISETGPSLDPEHGATCADISSSPTTLVVWQADEGIAGELEIHGQLLDLSGHEIGLDDFRISTTGAEGDPSVDATQPVLSEWTGLTWSPLTGLHCLVAWTADVTLGEKEIAVQALDPNGIAWGPPGARISTMGPDGSPDFFARSPAVANGLARHEYLVVWHGTDDVGGLAPGEQEIHGQRYTAGCTNAGDAAVRNAGTNPPFSLVSPDPFPVVASIFRVGVSNGVSAWSSVTLFAFQTKTSIAFPGGQVLLCFDDAGGELLTGKGLTKPLLPVQAFHIEIPANSALCGLQLTMQAIFTGPALPFVLSNALDLTVGG